MRENENPRTFILSAARIEHSAQVNRARHCDLALDLALAGVPFTDCEGSFQGVKESGFVVVGASAETAVKVLARAFAQDSYLCIAENDRTAYLVDCETGKHSNIGRFENVGTAEPAGDFTRCSGSYFQCTGSNGPDLDGGL